jgi:MATE family multidrug resistance protein
MFYVKNLLQIALPIILGNLGFVLIGVGDVIVAGRHSTDTLAAISLATAIINCITTFGIGILVSISPILSNYRGANKEPEKYFYPSLKFTVILSVLVSIVIFACIPFIDKLGFAPNLTPLIKQYFFITAFSTFGAYLHCMSKEFLQAFEIVIFPNVLTVFCIFLNVILNIIFVFGYGIVPEMGAAGLAIASLLTRYFMGIVLFLYCYKKINIKHHKDKNYYIDMIKVGTPSSLAILIEFVAFNSITVIMGRVNGLYAALQNIVCTITTVSFMIPLAIGNAAAVKVGFTNGAKDFATLKKYAFTAINMAVAFMALSAIIVSIAPGIILSWFTKDTAIITVGVPVVYVLCFFQVFDGLQAVLSGIFRGFKQTKIVMIANFIAYWLIALPVGCTLALHFQLNLLGFWYGLILSAIILCIIMLSNLLIRLKRLST